MLYFCVAVNRKYEEMKHAKNNPYKSFEQDWIRMFTHLANLFFEQSKISTDPEEDGILVDISINREGATITGFAQVTHNGNEYSATFSEQVTTDDSETETRQLKTDLFPCIPRSFGAAYWNETILGNSHWHSSNETFP